MIRRIAAFEFHRFMNSGRTGPVLASCEGDDGVVVDAVLKFSGGCDEGVVSLAIELFAAQLAADVGVPVPEPFVVEWVPSLTAALPEGQKRDAVLRSVPVAFGSRLATGGFAIWSPGHRLLDVAFAEALALFVFDALLQNPDRGVINPNCLVRGEQLLAIDHEATLRHRLILGWRPPWLLGGLNAYETPGFHILRASLKGRPLDFEAIKAAWSTISDERLQEYVDAVPAEWGAAAGVIQDCVALVRDVRDRLDDCLAEARRILE